MEREGTDLVEFRRAAVVTVKIDRHNILQQSEKNIVEMLVGFLSLVDIFYGF